MNTAVSLLVLVLLGSTLPPALLYRVTGIPLHVYYAAPGAHVVRASMILQVPLVCHSGNISSYDREAPYYSEYKSFILPPIL